MEDRPQTNREPEPDPREDTPCRAADEQPGVAGDRGGNGDVRFVLDESFGFLTTCASQAMKRELARQLRPHVLTAEQWVVLISLWNEQELSQRELAARGHKDPANITRICRLLEKKGLLERTACTTDARVSRVRLTEEGSRLVPDLIPRVFGALETCTHGVDPQELEVAKRVLQQIIANLL